MAIKKIEQEWCACTDEYRCSFIVDSASDVADLPKCCPGSTAVVAASGLPAYMVNASGEWVEV